jgi:hypothetical protein
MTPPGGDAGGLRGVQIPATPSPNALNATPTTIEAPSAPITLLSPAHDAALTINQPILIWTDPPGAAWLRVRVWRPNGQPLYDQRFSADDLTTLCYDGLCRLNLAEQGVRLRDGRRYTWRVIAMLPGEAEPVRTERRGFTVGDDAGNVTALHTPTPSVPSSGDSPAFGGMSTSCTLPNTTEFAVVTTVAELQEAVACANEWNRTTAFRVYLNENAPTFTFNTKLIIESKIEIYGRGADQSILDGNLTTQLFSVLTNGSLLLSHVTLQNARFNVSPGVPSYGGAIEIASANVEIRDSWLKDNRAGDGGGAISAVGNGLLRIERTQFTGNRAGGGAAVQMSSSAELRCVLFEGNVNNNYATALLVTGSGSATIRESAFRNTTTNEISVRNQSQVDARENYWEFLPPRVRTYESGTIDTSDVLADNPLGDTTCASPSPEVIPGGGVTLADFGVEVQYDGDFWNSVQQQETANVLEAVQLIAEALRILGVPGTTPQERFRSVFVRSQQGGNDLTITFLRLSPADQPTPEGTPYTFYYNSVSFNCLMNDVEDNTPETAPGYVIACRGFQSSSSWSPGGIPGYGRLTTETIIHELGHVIDARTRTAQVGMSLRQEITGNNLVDCRADGVNNPIMAFANRLGVSNPRGFEGWGSLSTSSTDVSRFQQNPTADAAETTADMFLNSVNHGFG